VQATNWIVKCDCFAYNINEQSSNIHPPDAFTRAGTGKSSIIQTQFRLTEPRDGEIFINGDRINDIGLNGLRQSFKVLSISLQDPVLFSGTVKYNWDPFGQ